MTKKEYNKTVQTYADRLFRYVIKNIRHEADAKDIVQQSFEKLWLKYENVEFSKVKSYLFTTAYHTLVDHTRKRKRMHIEHSIPEKITPTKHDRFELQDYLNFALNQLSSIQKKLILLRDYEGYSYKDIAEITELSESQVKVYIFRARKNMHKILVKKERVRKY